MSTPRVLVIAHGHPDFSLGGGEIAAHAQFRELRRRGIDALFVARTGHAPQHVGAPFSNRSADGREILFNAPPVNHFRHSQPDRQVIHRDFRALLERFRPTVVHFHHYVHLGLELLREVRHTAPDARLVLTLHEYLAICHAQGQMLKTNGLLCSKALPLDCQQCYPDIPAQDFFMRELYVKSFLALCDAFVCPSAFLRDRYVEWGLPAAKMHVLENGQPEGDQPDDAAAAAAPAAALASAGTASARAPERAPLHARFVVMGQFSRLKGTLLVLEAARLLPKAVRERVSIDLHGTMQHEPQEFKAQLQDAVQALEGMARYGGAYRPTDVRGIMQGAGWVIQPSIWWENSPLVIQEAFAARRPVICSNVGGMAEKVTPGVNGLHFRVGSATDLATRLEEAATQPELWERLCAGVRPPPSIRTTVDALLALYGAAPAPRLAEPLAATP